MSEVKICIRDQRIRDQRIRDLLCSAFEGGSNYWYRSAEPHLAPGLTAVDYKEGGKLQPLGDYWHWAELLPLVEGCHVTLETDDDGKEHKLDRAACERGLQIMAEKYPRHFADVVGETDDAETGDVFLQCCLFGEIVYG